MFNFKATSSTGRKSKNKRSDSSNQYPNSGATSSSNYQSYVILTIMCGKGNKDNEVGLATIDLYYPHLILCQFLDNHIYSNTLSKINTFLPEEIILPEIPNLNDANSKAQLYKSITNKFKTVKITYVPRTHFNASEGWRHVQTFSTEESSFVFEIVKSKFYALSATSALLKHVTSIQHLIYSPKTVKIEFQSSNDSAVIGLETIELLEVVSSLNEAFPNFNLYCAINRCVTQLGKKLLRSSLLQPLNNQAKIENRLDCVSEFASNHVLLKSLQQALKKLNGTEKLLSLSFKLGNIASVQLAQRNLNYLLLLKNTIDHLPEIYSVVNVATTPTIRQMCNTFQDPRFKDIKELILELIQEDAAYVHGSTSSNMQRCFAIKPKINELLDVIRQGYCELIDNMMQYVSDLRQKHCLQLSLGYNATSGYYMQLNTSKKQKVENLNLPKELIVIKENVTSVFLTTEELLVDSQKCKDICEEIYIMSNVLVEELLNKLRMYTGCLFQLCTDIAELDLIASLATISSQSGFVRPIFSHKLCILDAYHPTQLLLGFNTCIPNNVVASIFYNFHVITGPNMSGKTTFLKLIVLNHILAQIGCYVPATRAEIRLSDQFFYHSATYYTIRDNYTSHFELELRDLDMILTLMTDRSLVVLDEPCRTGSHDTGLHFAIAMCLLVADTKAFGFCSTHFLYLTRLTEEFMHITNLHFECEKNSNSSGTLIYTHKLKIGFTPISNYGIALARLCNFPESVLNDAEEIYKKLYNENRGRYTPEFSEELIHRKKCYAFLSRAYDCLVTDRFTSENISLLLKNIFDKDFKCVGENELALVSNEQTSTVLKEIPVARQDGTSNTISSLLKTSSNSPALMNEVPTDDVSLNSLPNEISSVCSAVFPFANLLDEHDSLDCFAIDQVTDSLSILQCSESDADIDDEFNESKENSPSISLSAVCSKSISSDINHISDSLSILKCSKSSKVTDECNDLKEATPIDSLTASSSKQNESEDTTNTAQQFNVEAYYQKLLTENLSLRSSS